MLAEFGRLGVLLELLYRSEHTQNNRGATLLLQVKEVETTTTLLSSIRSSCAEACPGAQQSVAAACNHSCALHRHW